MLKSKIHRATVTHADVDYHGSLSLDVDLLEAADIVPHEEVRVWNVNSAAADWKPTPLRPSGAPALSAPTERRPICSGRAILSSSRVSASWNTMSCEAFTPRLSWSIRIIACVRLTRKNLAGQNAEVGKRKLKKRLREVRSYLEHAAMNCTRCGERIRAADADLDLVIAKCAACHNVFPFDPILTPGPKSSEAPRNLVCPENLHSDDSEPDRRRITHRWFTFPFVFVVEFAVVWNVGSWVLAMLLAPTIQHWWQG